MSETLGSLVDKLQVTNLKMWNNQEFLYKLRKMSLEEFSVEYIENDGGKSLYETLKKCCDLNVQRNDLIDEIDNLFEHWINLASTSELDTHSLVQKKHKTY